MANVHCQSCGKVYNYEKEGCCPACGAYNRRPRREWVGADGTVRHMTEEEFARGKGAQGKVCFEEKECHEEKVCYEDQARHRGSSAQKPTSQPVRPVWQSAGQPMRQPAGQPVRQPAGQSARRPVRESRAAEAAYVPSASRAGGRSGRNARKKSPGKSVAIVVGIIILINLLSGLYSQVRDTIHMGENQGAETQWQEVTVGETFRLQNGMEITVKGVTASEEDDDVLTLALSAPNMDRLPEDTPLPEAVLFLVDGDGDATSCYGGEWTWDDSGVTAQIPFIVLGLEDYTLDHVDFEEYDSDGDHVGTVSVRLAA